MTKQPFTIQVCLPANRWNAGVLHVFDPSGKCVLKDIPCRGKADGGRAKKEGNSSRDTTKPFGDTPLGLYRPSKITHYDPPRNTVGSCCIWLVGQSGDALKAVQNNRTGLALHANRGNEKLMATYGCIRVFERDMAQISEAIGDERVTVTIDIDSQPNEKDEV